MGKYSIGKWKSFVHDNFHWKRNKNGNEQQYSKIKIWLIRDVILINYREINNLSKMLFIFMIILSGILTY